MNRILLSAILSVVLLPAAAQAATPAIGVPQEIRSGFFADVNMGAFFALGGVNSDNQSAPSNAQAYLQLGVGYDILKNVSLGVNFGLGTSAASCFSTIDKGGNCSGIVDGKSARMSDNFTATMFTLEAAYKHYFSERFTLQPRLHLGYAMLDPAPVAKNDKEVTGGPLFGLGVGVEYATRMDHFSIGADVYGRYISGPNAFTVAVYPKIKYTF